MIKLLNSFSPKEKSIFYTVILFFIIFLIFRVSADNFYLTDSYEYLDVAKRIRDLSLFNTKTPFPLATKRPFVYPLFLALFYSFPMLVSIIFQMLVGVFTIFLLFKIIKKFGLEIKRAYLWFFICTPSIYIYTQLIMAEWLIMFFIVLLFWLLLQKWSIKNFAYIQIVTLLLAFTKPVFYPLIYVNFVFFGIYMIKKKVFSFWLFIPIVVLQSYMFFNEIRTGYKHFSSIENSNLINYNLYYFKSKTESEEKAEQWLDSVYSPAYKKKSFREQNIYLDEIARKEIKQHFFQYSYYHLFTSIRGIFDPGRFDLMTFFKKEDGKQGFLELLNKKENVFEVLKNKFAFIYLLLIPIFLINLIKWFYFFKALIIKKFEFKVYYIVLLLACYVLITGPVNSSRYMMPFQGIIIVFAILGLRGKKNEEIKA